MKNKKLEEWANSFSGCDGGDINSDVWLCGIEWGYTNTTDKDREEYYEKTLPTWIKKGKEKLNTDYNFFEDKESDGTEYPFNLAFKKIFFSIQKELNFPNKLLKLNLSPIPFNKDNDKLWTQPIQEATNFETKESFMKYIINLNRFTKIRDKYKPKLIFCIGNGRRTEFVNTFFGKYNLKLQGATIRPDINEKNQNNRYIYYAKYDNTLFVVTPFSTNSNGLNSDFLKEEVAKKIIKLLQET